MGASASKPVRKAAQTAIRRQYPQRPSPSATNKPAAAAAATQQPPPPPSHPTQPKKQGPTYHPDEKASNVKSEVIDLDGRDPDFAASLRSIGPVIPNPTFSNSSTFNRPSSSTTARTTTTTANTNTRTNASPTRTVISPSAGPPPAAEATQRIRITPSHANANANASRDSTNPALTALSARSRLYSEAEKELESFGKQSHAGRQFLDVITIRQILAMRDRERIRPEDIERHFRLKKGVVGRLGSEGIVGEAR